MKNLILAVAISTLCAPMLHAQTAAAPAVPPAVSPVPPYGADKPLPVPKIAKKTLANGLQVWVVPRAGLPRVDFVLAVRCLLYTSPSPRDGLLSRMPSSA